MTGMDPRGGIVTYVISRAEYESFAGRYVLCTRRCSAARGMGPRRDRMISGAVRVVGNFGQPALKPVMRGRLRDCARGKLGEDDFYFDE